MSATCKAHEADLRASQERVRELEQANIRQAEELSGVRVLLKMEEDIRANWQRRAETAEADNTRLTEELLESNEARLKNGSNASNLRAENTRHRAMLVRLIQWIEGEGSFVPTRLVAEAKALAGPVTCEHCPEHPHPLNDDGTACKRPVPASEKAGAAGTKPEGLAAVQPDPEGQPPRSGEWSTGAPR